MKNNNVVKSVELPTTKGNNNFYEIIFKNYVSKHIINLLNSKCNTRAV
jgi:hypothetical protein